jgi:hypothetical protein
LPVDKTPSDTVERELRSHEIWEIQVDAFLKLDRGANKQGF